MPERTQWGDAEEGPGQVPLTAASGRDGGELVKRQLLPAVTQHRFVSAFNFTKKKKKECEILCGTLHL